MSAAARRRPDWMEAQAEFTAERPEITAAERFHARLSAIRRMYEIEAGAGDLVVVDETAAAA